MKSNSSGPDFARMSRRNVAMEAWLRSTSSVTMAGSVSIVAGSLPTGISARSSSGRTGMKSPRSRTVRSASPISGSDLPMPVTRASRLAGEASIWVTSTNSLPPISAIVRGVVSCHIDSPRGFMGSVIIC